MASQMTRRPTSSLTLLGSKIGNLLSFVHTHMQSLTVDKDVILRRIFLCQLLEDVQVQVAALDTTNLSTLVRKTDTIMAVK